MEPAKPTNRMEAIAEATRENGHFLLWSMFAVVRAFPLDERETREQDEMLARLRKNDPGFADYIERRMEEYLTSWGVAGKGVVPQ